MNTVHWTVGIVLILGLGTLAATPAKAVCFDCLVVEFPGGTTRFVCLTGGPDDGWEICSVWSDSYCHIDWPCGGIGWHFPWVSFDVEDDPSFALRTAAANPRSSCSAGSDAKRKQALPTVAVRYAA